MSISTHYTQEEYGDKLRYQKFINTWTPAVIALQHNINVLTEMHSKPGCENKKVVGETIEVLSKRCHSMIIAIEKVKAYLNLIN